MISDSTIQAIRDLPIDQVVGRYVKLTKYAACCPFHEEQTPSFRVTPPKGIFKCFGCGEAGDGIAFVQKIESLSFYETLEKLAKDHNIEIKYDDSLSEEARKERKDKEDLAAEVLAFTNQFFRKNLQENPDALAYLNQRGFTDEDIDFWEIGFAPDSYKSLTQKIIAKNWFNIAGELGLIRTKEGNTYDFYRNRITIPIRNKMGMLVGFGARSLGDEKPKYINPSESFLYHKSVVLFGLDKASKAIRESKNVHLVEGYFDVISMHKAGAINTIASCGTAVDEKHLQEIKKYTDTITLMQDGDKAGIKAVTDLVPRCLKLNLNTLVAVLDGQDPDDFSQQFLNNEKRNS